MSVLYATSDLPVGAVTDSNAREGMLVRREVSNAPLVVISFTFEITVVRFAPLWELTVYASSKTVAEVEKWDEVKVSEVSKNSRCPKK